MRTFICVAIASSALGLACGCECSGGDQGFDGAVPDAAVDAPPAGDATPADAPPDAPAPDGGSACDTPCTSGERCDEATGTCVSCDVDGDTHQHIDCAGDDCDDDDSDRFFGNSEVCDETGHDEDCDPTTFGDTDLDDDGYVASVCCNEDADGTTRCGDDCDDARDDVHPTLTEVCNGRDDNCDGRTDEDVMVPLYADTDGDGHGDSAAGSSGCPGTPGLVESSDDCDDTDGARFPGAVEACNGADDDCDGTPDDGADAACSLPSAIAICTGGTCVVDGCVGVTGNCDGTESNGCERPLTTLSDCGMCGSACSLSHATEMCTGAGACEVASCDGGYGNCDSLHATGCEQPLNTSTHCGGCGVGCSRAHATATCSTGSCAISRCDSGWCNPPGSGDSDGCERQIDSNPVCVGGSSLPVLIDVDGDSSDVSGLTAMGSGEMWFRAIIRETNTDAAGDPACDDLGARFRITSTGDAIYTMNIHCASCGGTSTYVGLTPAVISKRDGPTCVFADTVEDLTVYIQVELASNVRTGCGAWTVTAEPDIRPTSYTCP